MKQNGTLPFLDVLVIKNSLIVYRLLKFFVNQLIQSHTFMFFFQTIWIRLKFQRLVTFFLQLSINFIDDEINQFRSYLRKIGYSYFNIDKAYFKNVLVSHELPIVTINLRNVFVLPNINNDTKLFNFSEQLDFKLVTSTKIF